MENIAVPIAALLISAGSLVLVMFLARKKAGRDDMLLVEDRLRRDLQAAQDEIARLKEEIKYLRMELEKKDHIIMAKQLQIESLQNENRSLMMELIKFRTREEE